MNVFFFLYSDSRHTPRPWLFSRISFNSRKQKKKMKQRSGHIIVIAHIFVARVAVIILRLLLLLLLRWWSAKRNSGKKIHSNQFRFIYFSKNPHSIPLLPFPLADAQSMALVVSDEKLICDFARSPTISMENIAKLLKFQFEFGVSHRLCHRTISWNCFSVDDDKKCFATLHIASRPVVYRDDQRWANFAFGQTN